MSIQKRLFIGNIHADVTESDLKSRFNSFGTVGNVEVRSKNDDHFAFMNIEFPDIHAMRNCKSENAGRREDGSFPST